MDSSVKKKWADVVLPYPPFGRFTYEVPDRFSSELCPGHRVLVPLGRRWMTGIVVDFVDHPEIQNLREIEDILDPYPLLTSKLLKLTRWIAEYYLVSWGEVIRTALPPGIFRKSRFIIYKNNKNNALDASLSDIQKDILTIVQEKGKISLQSLEKRLGQKKIRFVIGKLEKLKLIRTEHILEESRVRIKSEKWISLREEFDPETVKNLNKKAPKQADTVSMLMKYGGEVRRSDLDIDFSILRKLEKNGWIDIWEKEVFRESYQEIKSDSPRTYTLTEEQARAFSEIDNALKKKHFHVFLLHGVTASGKTQVYIESIQKVLDQGKTVLVLIPEISLTPQAVQRYRGKFGDRVAVLHSRMSSGERYDSWRKIREGKCQIGLGPRSAVFAPLQNLGLIIVDEEHETSYKQIDPAPRYHARDVAIVRGKFNDCVVILGSATPSVESYFNSLNGKYTLCRMTRRVDRTPMPRVIVVNQKEKEQRRGSKVFSPLLQEKMTERLERGEQVILLQNRRGYAPFLQCGDCGNIEECPHCDITLTYHQKYHQLRCHYCGFQKRAPDACSNCGGVKLRYRGIGTQRVEEEVAHFFPGTRLLRMDQDTTRRKGAHERIIMEFERGEGNILLGTQMVAKGHDFPGVNLVGIISADTGLHFPDFRSGERTFQLLTQAAGRAGRRNLRGEVVIQTYSPDNQILEFAIEQDYVKFYQWEIEQRKGLGYPPWGRLVAVRFKGEKKERVEKAAHSFSEVVAPCRFFEKLGPVPSPLSRIRGLYRYQIIFKGKGQHDPSGKILRNSVRKGIIRYYEKTDFPDVRAGIDVDPVDML